MKTFGLGLALLASSCAAEPPPGPAPPRVTTAPELPPPSAEPTPPAAPPPVCETDGDRAFSGDGSLLAVRRDSGISIYETRGWVLRSVLPAGPEGMLQFAGPLFAVSEKVDKASDRSRVRVLDRTLALVFEAPRAPLRPDGDLIVAAPDGKSFLIVVEDDARTPTADTPLERVELWGVSPPKKQLSFPVPETDYVNHLAFDARGDVLIGAGTKLTLLSSSGTPLAAWDYRSDAPPVFSHAGSAFVFRYDQWAELWSSADRRVRTLRDKDCDGQGIVWSPDDKTVVLGGFSYNLCLFDAKTGRLKGTLPSPRVKAQTFEDEGMTEPRQFSPDGRLLIGHGLFDLFVFDVKRGQKIDPLKTLGPDVSPWNANDTRIVRRARDDVMLVVDRGHVQARFEAGRLVAQDVSADALRQLTVSSDAELFVRFDKHLQVVETKPGGKVVELEGTEDDQDVLDQSLVFSPGNALVMSSFLGPLRIWSTQTGKRVGPKRDQRCPAK